MKKQHFTRSYTKIPVDIINSRFNTLVCIKCKLRIYESVVQVR